MESYTKYVLLTFVGINWENPQGNDRKDIIICALALGTKIVSVVEDKNLKVHYWKKYLDIVF